MKLGSLFDGSGTAPLAAAMCGIEPVWASEIEPFPISVTSRRFPGMKHLGSITDISGAEIEPVDIICGGSPCQDLSVAGKQAGLHEGKRSHLFFEMTRIIREMRGATNEEYPRYVIWENVPGAFSSNKGEDFLAVLRAFAEIAEPDVHVPRPESKGNTDRLVWQYAGTVVGDGYSIAWRTVDAQYWGVPQRRRRIYLVADLGSERAGEILFERTGLSGHLEPRGAAREGAAGDASGSTGGKNCFGLTNRGFICGDIVETWRANCHCAYPICCYPAVARTLTAEHDASPCIDRGQNIVAAFMGGQGAKARSIAYCDDGSTPTLKSATSGSNTVPDVVYALQGNGIDRSETAGCNGAGWRENECYTLNTIDHHAVAFAADCRNMALSKEVSGTLQAKPGGGYSLNYQNPVVYPGAGITSKQNKSNPKPGDPAPTITTKNGRNYLVHAFDMQAFGKYGEGATGSSLKQRDYKDATDLVVEKIDSHRNYVDRRLIPLECCRLQGFPDYWIDGCEAYPISGWWHENDGWRRWIDPRGAIHSSDSAKYKLWGNGMALPNMLFVMARIAEREGA